MSMQRSISSKKRKRSFISKSVKRYRRNTSSFKGRSAPNKYNNMRPDNVLTWKGIMPQTLRTIFTYNESLGLNSDSGVYGTMIYRANSPFDPRQATGGAQPPGFDQLAPFYQTITVYASRCIVKVANTSATPFYFYLYPSINTTTTSATYDTIRSMPKSKSLISPGVNGGGLTILTNYGTTADVLGLGTSTAGTTSTFTSNASTQWYWIAGVAPVDSSNVTYIINIEITYYCLLNERLVVANS